MNARRVGVMNNKRKGDKFESDFVETLSKIGFWVHLLKQNQAGQPADVIAVKDKNAYLIDCKDCSTKGFDLRRVEDNQALAMDLWFKCGNGQGWFALNIHERVYMLPYETVMAYKNNQSMMSFEEIFAVAKPLGEWVKRCK